MILFLILVIFLWLMPILFARFMGKRLEIRNAWLWGFFLSWLGVFILAFRGTGKIFGAMKDAGLSTTLSGAARDAAPLISRLKGEVEGGKKCPDCAETVRGDATVCRFCGHKFETVEAPPKLA
jgi:hypothetical protein